MYGDSLAYDAADQLQFWMPLGGQVHLDLATMPGTALCDWIPSMRAVQRSASPAAIVVALTGNAFTPCMRDLMGQPLSGELRVRKYLEDAREVVRLFGPSTPILFVGWPPQAGDKGGARADEIRDVYRAVARESRNAIYVDATRYLVDTDGSFVRTRTCLAFEPCGPDGTNVVRAPDGVHFCPVAKGNDPCPVWSSGAMRYALSVSSALRRALHLGLSTTAGASAPTSAQRTIASAAPSATPGRSARPAAARTLR